MFEIVLHGSVVAILVINRKLNGQQRLGSENFQILF